MKSKTVINSSVVETDAFLSLPLTAQGLYMHLNLYCDSMGAVDSITIPKRVCGASDNDVAALRAGGWIIEVDGVTFIRDWLVHNTVREKDYSGPDSWTAVPDPIGNPGRLESLCVRLPPLYHAASLNPPSCEPIPKWYQLAGVA